MRVLVAPDKLLKGSLTATATAAAISAGVRDAVPEADILVLPIADGGDGTVDAALGAGAEAVRLSIPARPGAASVHDVTVARLAGPPRTVVVEVAQVGGLGGRQPSPEEARAASSWAAGALIAAALELGPERVVLGVGGMASTDAGAGALVALGARFIDDRGQQVPLGLAGLAELTNMDLSGLDRRLFGPRVPVELIVAADVESPLTGPDGAAMVFGPQKGLPWDEAVDADAILGRFARMLEIAAGFAVDDLPGAGAGGGLAGGLCALLRAPPRPGAEEVFSLVGIDEALSESDVVFTAEGCLDEQSRRGKAPVALARRAQAAGVPVLSVAGRVTLDEEGLRAAGIEAAAALLDLDPDVERAMVDPAPLVTQAAASLVRRWMSA